MKRWLILPMLLSVLLAGCGDKQQEPVDTTVPSTTPAQTEAAGLYEPGSVLEQQTGGAVKAYPLGEDTYDGILPMGEDLLLCSRNNTRLTLAAGQNLIPVAEKKVDFHIALVQTGSGSAAYLDPRDGTVVFLNTALQEISRLQMPEDMIGQAWLSQQQDRVYYCTRSGIRALDLETGVSRLVLEQYAEKQSVTGVFMDGAVLRCEVQEGDSCRTKVIAANTGEILWEGDALSGLTTAGENWFASMDRGMVEELLFGQGDTIRNLWLEDPVDGILPLPERNAVLALRETSRGCSLDYYDLATGRRIAAAELPGVQNIRDACADAAGTGVWLLARDAESNTDMICHWEPSISPTEDQTVYTQPHYTRENPDTEGLEALRTEVQKLEQQYGVKILLGEKTTETVPGNAAFVTEYLVPAFERSLPVLEQAMSQFPEGFFQTAAQGTKRGVISIGLVREIQGTLPDLPVLQFWQDGDAILVLTMTEDLEQNFYHGISHVMETRILSTSAAFYDWEQLNPEGFAYDNDYIKNLDREDPQYLEGENRAFVDTFSMSFEKEDRARILEYACMPGNEELFRWEIMQRKLKVLCTGIREAFGLEDSSEAFTWEQYLIKETDMT